MDYFIKKHEWEEIFRILSNIKRIHTKNEASTRRFIEAIWFISRTGCQWRLLPFHYGYWRSIHRRFKKWTDKGIWEVLFLQTQKEPDLEAVMIDATIVRAHAGSVASVKGGC
jgi:transposase